MTAAPWTRSEEAEIVEEAIRFIRDRVEVQRLELCLEVGEHIFVNLFKGDLDLYRRGGRWKERALSRIAADPRVGLSDQELANCVRCHLAVREFGRVAPDIPLPRLTPWEWGSLFFPLEHDPGALVAIAQWVAAEQVQVEFLKAVAQSVRPYLEAGGRLEDLLARADTTRDMVMRLLGIVRKKIVQGGVPEVGRARAIEILRGMLARVEAASGRWITGSRSPPRSRSFRGRRSRRSRPPSRSGRPRPG